MQSKYCYSSMGSPHPVLYNRLYIRAGRCFRHHCLSYTAPDNFPLGHCWNSPMSNCFHYCRYIRFYIRPHRLLPSYIHCYRKYHRRYIRLNMYSRFHFRFLLTYRTYLYTKTLFHWCMFPHSGCRLFQWNSLQCS